MLVPRPAHALHEAIAALGSWTLNSQLFAAGQHNLSPPCLARLCLNPDGRLHSACKIRSSLCLIITADWPLHAILTNIASALVSAILHQHQLWHRRLT